MKNKNGFTLIELTVSITLILLLIILVVPGLVNLGDNSKETMYESQISLALTSAYKYGIDNIDTLDQNCKEITIGTLIELNYLTPDDKSKKILKDPLNGGDMNDVVLCIYYQNGEVKTKVK